MTDPTSKIDRARQRVKEIFVISSELENDFPGRKFTPDGHLLGSIGEVIAAYFYSLELLPSSADKHDAISPDGRHVQIKITQGNHGIALRSEPDHLIVLWLDHHTGDSWEVYNGPGSPVWNACRKISSNGTRSIGMAKLKKIAAEVPAGWRIEPAVPIGKI